MDKFDEAERTDWEVYVWMRIDRSYTLVLTTNDETAARREANWYRSDSRGIKIRRPDGEFIQIKDESKF